ncbi:MAG: RHS repeat-associated core domain-containing protein, partial [Terriglobales bacterium]
FNTSGAITGRNLVGLNPAGVDAIMAQEAVNSPVQDGAVSWMIDDNLGSEREVLDSNSNVLDTTVYTTFGQTTSESNPSTAHWTGFAGGHADTSTSLVLSGERAYVPSTGGWNSKDPIGFAAGDPNTGRYTGNSPTNGIDPTGLAPEAANSVQEWTISVTFGWVNVGTATVGTYHTVDGSNQFGNSFHLEMDGGGGAPPPSPVVVWPKSGMGPPQTVPAQPPPQEAPPYAQAPTSSGTWVYFPPTPAKILPGGYFPPNPGGLVFIPTQQPPGPQIGPAPPPIPKPFNPYYPFPNEPNKPAPKVGETPMLGPGQPKPQYGGPPVIIPFPGGK